MAIVSCPECDGDVSSAAAACPHCGYPIGDDAVATAASSVRAVQQSAGALTETAEQQGFPLTESEVWFSYRGRIGVGQYWGRFLVALVGVFIVSYVLYSSATTVDAVDTIDGVVALFSIFAIWPSTALAWKRLHDTGRSGGYFFLVLIPLAGPIIWLVFSLTGSAPGPNEYGPRAGHRY